MNDMRKRISFVIPCYGSEKTISFVTEDIPPVMIQQGHEDGIVPYQHSEILAEKIAEVCGPDRVECHIYEGRNHSDPAFLTEESVRQVVDFFDRKLKN